MGLESRRDLLRKGVVGGSLIWVAPVITTSRAYAQAGSVGVPEFVAEPDVARGTGSIQLTSPTIVNRGILITLIQHEQDTVLQTPGDSWSHGAEWPTTNTGNEQYWSDWFYRSASSEPQTYSWTVSAGEIAGLLLAYEPGAGGNSVDVVNLPTPRLATGGSMALNTDPTPTPISFPTATNLTERRLVSFGFVDFGPNVPSLWTTSPGANTRVLNAPGVGTCSLTAGDSVEATPTPGYGLSGAGGSGESALFTCGVITR
jgi:hypothetical protein